MLQKSKFELWKKRDYGGRTITDSKHLFAQEHKKSSYEIRNCLYSSWTNLGLNQGSPDYESFCMVFHGITYYINILIAST